MIPSEGIRPGAENFPSERDSSSPAPSAAREKASRSSAPAGFDEFWQAYPKKTGKGAAIKAYQTAIKITGLETMLGAIAVQRNSEQWCKDGGQFVPNPATWLNQMRWEDQLTVDVRKPKAEKSLAMKILESL